MSFFDLVLDIDKEFFVSIDYEQLKYNKINHNLRINCSATGKSDAAVKTEWYIGENNVRFIVQFFMNSLYGPGKNDLIKF